MHVHVYKFMCTHTLIILKLWWWHLCTLQSASLLSLTLCVSTVWYTRATYLRACNTHRYAQLLMRTVTGSIYPEETFPDAYVNDNFPKQPYNFEKRQYGLDFPGVGHTMVFPPSFPPYLVPSLWRTLPSHYFKSTCRLTLCSSKYVYIYAFVDMHTCVHVCICTHTRTHTNTQTHIRRWDGYVCKISTTPCAHASLRSVSFDYKGERERWRSQRKSLLDFLEPCSLCFGNMAVSFDNTGLFWQCIGLFWLSAFVSPILPCLFALFLARARAPALCVSLRGVNGNFSSAVQVFFEIYSRLFDRLPPQYI